MLGSRPKPPEALERGHVEFRILGPLEVWQDGKQLAPSGHKARALLALLLLHANEPVTADRLVEEVWGDQLPANSAKTLQIHVSRLRKSLGADRLERVGGGYALTVGEGELDSDRAASLVERGDRSLDLGEAEAASALFREALVLFQGRPLGEFAYEGFAQAERARLEDLQLKAREGWLEAELALGRGAQLTGELEALVAQHPLRERLYGQQMLALYQAGRQADALDVYHDARRRFMDELGLEPGPALQELERRILNQDPELGARLRHTGIRQSSDRARLGRRRAAVLAGAAVLLGGTLIALAAREVVPSDSALPARSLVMLDPETLTRVATLSLGGIPTDVVLGRRAVFVAIPGRGSVVVVDPRTRAVASLGAPVRRPTRLATGKAGLWVLDGVARRVGLLGSDTVHAVPAAPARGAAPLDALATDDRSIWLAERDAEYLYLLDLRNGRARLVENGGRDSFFDGDARRTVALTEGSAWSSNPVSVYPSTDRLGRVSRLDTTTGEVTASVRVPAPPVAMAADDQAVWVALDRGETVWRIDPYDTVATTTINVPGGVIDLAIGERAVWALGRDGSLSRIDPQTNTVTAHTNLGAGALLAVGAGAVWIATQ